MTKRLYEPFLGHPTMTEYQEAQVRLLDQCADRWQKETGKVACGGCPKMDYCYQAWDKKTDSRYGVDLR